MDCCQKGLFLINLDVHWRTVQSIYINKEEGRKVGRPPLKKIYFTESALRLIQSISHNQSGNKQFFLSILKIWESGFGGKKRVHFDKIEIAGRLHKSHI